MAKKMLQDMVKAKTADTKKNWETEAVSNKKDESIRIVIKKEKNSFEYSAPEVGQIDSTDYSNNDGFKYGLWVVAIIAVLFLLFAISFLFSGATVTVNPKIQDIVLNQSLNAVKDSGNGSGNNNLAFDLMAIPGQETETVQSGTVQNVLARAEGMVRVFNAFSSFSQTLAADTRLIGSNGKIYKTEVKIIVPGMTADGTPGSAEVNISGSEAGASYNSTPLDFKIFGFKGTAKYSKIYAESEGDITVAQLSNAQKTNAVGELRTMLQTDLMEKATNQIPSGYILFKDAVFLNDDGGTTGIASSVGAVPVTLNGTLYGFLFKVDDLTKQIVQENVENYDGSPVYISNLQNLTFAMADKSVSFPDVTNINFTLSGPMKAVWKVDTDQLISDLLGKRKGDFNQILSGYSDIDSADLTIKPVWGMSFPDKSKDIKVIVNYPK